MRKRIRTQVTSAADAVGFKLSRAAAMRRSEARAGALNELGILDGIRFGVTLAVGLGPETRFRLESWHRLAARMHRDDTDQVVLSRAQVEWLLEQVPSPNSEG